MKIEVENLDLSISKNSKHWPAFEKMIDDLFAKYDVEPNFKVENKPKDLIPQYYRHRKTIKLAIHRGFFVKQIIYQLAHEMIHHLASEVAGVEVNHGIYQPIEETLCCAFALFVLKKLGFNWYYEEELNAEHYGSHQRVRKEIIDFVPKLLEDFDKNFQIKFWEVLDEFQVIEAMMNL